MKKLIATTLAIILTFSLCACGQDSTPTTGENQTTINNGNTENQTPSSESTEPATPTSEELAVLKEYETLINELYSVKGTHTLFAHSVKVKDCYNKLVAMDLSVIDKWRGTQYASANVEWDYNAILSSFVTLKDVMLGYKETTSDALGNFSTTEKSSNVIYDENGLTLYMDIPFLMTDVYAEHSKQVSLSIIDGQFSFYEDDPLCFADNNERFPQGYFPKHYLNEDGKIEKTEWRHLCREGHIHVGQMSEEIIYLVTPTYDDEGKITSATVLSAGSVTPYIITYVYDDNHRLSEICVDCEDDPEWGVWFVYVYNEEGLPTWVVKYSKPKKYFADPDFSVFGSKNDVYACTLELFYDDNGHLKEATQSNKKWNYTYKEWITESTMTDTFTCDENGRILTENVQNTSGKNITREIIYGDYYIFNPSENS